MSKMSRRRLLSSAAGTAALSAAGADSARGADPRPNFLWICTDQQRWDTIHALNNPHIRTPNLDRLAGDGVAFEKAYCQSPICTPSRSSFLTGMYASTVHNCTNGNESWSEAAPLVTKLLADEGYDCGLAGKFHLSAAHNRIEPRVDDGYRVFDWSHHPQDSWPRGHAYKDWLSEQGVDYKSTHEKRGSIPPEFHQTKWCADRAIEFLREKREKPWLFSYNCFDPHPPFDPPQEYLRHYPVESVPGPLFRDSDLEQQSRMQGRVAFQSEVRRPEEFQAKATIAKYWAMIEQIDDHVGRILEALDESGQRENTVVIFTSDHGEMLGDHGLLLKGCRFYDGLVRVPLIVSWPGHFPRGVRSSALVELTDLAPTLMEIAASTAPGRMQGQSLKPLLEGRTRSHRDFVRSEYYRTLQGIPSHATMVRSERFKQVVYHDTGLGELFDMEEDSGEFENLWDDPRLADVRHEHVVMNFDALAAAVDVGSRRVGRY